MEPAELNPIDEVLHAAAVESLERRIMDFALERTGSSNGAIFLWDDEADGLALDFHMVGGLCVNLPSTVLRHRHDGRPNGIALWVHDHNAPYLCPDTSRDPEYASYFLDVASIAAVPIPYQDRAIGVLSVSSAQKDAYSDADIEVLGDIADHAAKFLRRAQLFRTSEQAGRRVLLVKGLSDEWLEVERMLERASPTDVPVLVRGESGTGKELVARSIHFNSLRANKPFITVNCAAIPEQLLESTLFGHKRGAFTGATINKVGEFTKAAGGTLFLDEVGELSLALQPKLLRAVEDGEVQPVGSNDPPKRVDVRLVCATNRDLAELVRRGEFREDLYHRLGVVTLQLPPLRRYRHNLPLLAQIFANQAAERHGKPHLRVGAAAMALLEAHPFPGNVRELKNALEHAVIMASGEVIEPQDLPLAMRPSAPADEPSAPAPAPTATLKQLRELWLAPHEKRYLTDLLAECHGNVRRAAQRAGVNPVTMYRLLKKWGLRLTREVRSD